MLDTKKLKAAREAAELTQEQAAQAVGLASRQSWNNVERGRIDVTLSTLDKIAGALGVDPCDLLVKRSEPEKTAKPKGRVKK